MNKKILLLFAFIISSFSVHAQQCQNLNIENTEATCAIPTTTLEATFLNLEYKTTDTYVINDEFPCPPEIINDPTGISVDDQWSPTIFNIGFTFCFYGNMYDQIIVSGNGVVSFDLGVVEDYLVTNPNGNGPFHVWNTNASLDLPSPQLQPNAIFCYTDPHMGRPSASASAELLNEDNPGNRIFALELESPMYSCTSEFYHVIFRLYETSNVIDIEILEKGRCDAWENSTGIVGIQNKSATLAVTAPGRTNADGGWWVNGDPDHGGNVAEQELWRFVPDGNPLNYSFEWFADYGDGNGYQELFPEGNAPPTIVVNPETDTEYQAVLTYHNECSFDEITLVESVLVEAPVHDNVTAPEDLTTCEEALGAGTADFNLDQFDFILSEYINSTTETWDMTDFTVSYHASEADRDDEVVIDPIDVYNATDGTIIYVRILYDNGSINCFDVFNEFTLHISPLDDPTFNYSQSMYCTADNNPSPLATTPGGSYTIDNGGVIDATTGEIDLVNSGAGDDGLGIFVIAYTTAGIECPNSTDVSISIEVTEDAGFTYPSTACKADTDNPMPTITTAGGTFEISPTTGDIDATTGELNLATTPAGNYEITYSFNTGGNCPSTSSVFIDVFEEDDASFSYPNATYCNDDSNPSPTANTAGGTYTINNGGIIDENTGIINLNNSGLGNDNSGSFVVIYTTSGNCETSSEVTITIEITEDPSFDFPTDICFSDTNNPQAFNVTTTGGDFSVNNGANISSNGILDLSSTSADVSYIITYSFNNGGNCPSSSSNTINVHASPTANMPSTLLSECNNGDGTANFDISMLDDEVLGGQANMTLTYHPTQTDANNNSNELMNQPVRVSENIWARVENTNGCFSIVEIPVEIRDCYAVLPEGFSPNSNIVENQTFDVTGLREMFPKFTLTIYNRYGKLVYEGDTSAENWNGKMNNEGELLPVGTYYYAVKLNDEQDLKYRGWVYLQQ